MILEQLRLRYFRNFEDQSLSFHPGKNIIIGNNGTWKTNILEALALPCGYLVEWDSSYLAQKGTDTMALHYTFTKHSLLYSYDTKSNKKKYFIEQKSITKPHFQTYYPHIISFHPGMMDLLYGSPSTRRDFLDEILMQAFSDYHSKLSHYKKILSSRNKILARISEGKSELSELEFWDEQYIQQALVVYKYRDTLGAYFEAQIGYMKEYFFGKVEHITFQTLSKTPKMQREWYLREYIIRERNKEILLRKTLRGPHLDDFEIYLDDIALTHFASRGEVKSVLLWLKFLGGEFIISHAEKKEILFLIDDILSELDELHIERIYQYIWERQCIISSIYDIEVPAHKIYI